MASKGASAVLRRAMTMKPGASLPPFMVLPFPPPTLGPTYRPPGEQHLLPLKIPSSLPGQPLVLPAFPRTPLVVGDASHGPSGTGACNINGQVRPEGGRAEAPQAPTFVLTPAPLNWSAPGALCGGAACPAPLFLEASVVETIMLGLTLGGTQAVEGGWTPGRPPQAAAPADQLAPIVPPLNAGLWPNQAAREGGPDTSQSKSSPDDPCNPTTVDEDFRRWQRFKALARRHLPQSPDAGALCCFLIPLLWSLSRLKPTMTLEEGLRRAMQKWQHTSNLDRMIFHEMAEKFLELEVEEEMQIQKLQGRKGTQDLPLPAPPRPDPWGPPAPVVGPQPVCIPKKAIPRTQAACPQPHRLQWPREPEAPKEIPPEAVRESMDIVEELAGLAQIATGQPGAGWEENRTELQEEEDGTYPHPGLLSYIDQLCSQEDFVTKVLLTHRLLPAKDAHSFFLLFPVEAVIHPRFLEQLLSPESQLDLLALAEELEWEEALTPAQLVEERPHALEEEPGVQGPLSHGAPRLDLRTSESEASQDAQRRDRDPQLWRSDKACPPEADFKDPQGHRRADAHLSRPKAFAVSSVHQEFPPLRAPWSPSPLQGHSHTSSGLGPSDVSTARETAPVRETCRPAEWPSDDEDQLPSLSFLLDAQNSLLPWRFPQSPVPASDLIFPGVWEAWGAPQSLAPQRSGLSRVDPPAAKSRKRALGAGPAPAEETLLPGANLGFSGRPALAPGLVCSSQPPKRKYDPSVTGRKRKRH